MYSDIYALYLEKILNVFSIFLKNLTIKTGSMLLLIQLSKENILKAHKFPVPVTHQYVSRNSTLGHNL